MNRRQFVRTTAAAAALGGAASAAGDRPNLLIVMTDQQFAEALSCRAGREFLHTPHMDSLAAQGAFFSRAYAANPLCVPSRTSMFTGRYPTETRVQSNDQVQLDPAVHPVMGAMFKSAGYATAYFGKWHLPYPEKGGQAHGFDIVERHKAAGDDDTAVKAAAWLRQNKKAPWLMVASFLNPHNICQWARSEELPDGPIGDPPAAEKCPPRRANHQPQQGEPDAVALLRRSYQSGPKFPVANFDGPKWRQYIWAYFRMIEKVDALVGQVLTALRETGQEERTVVVFLSDHGDCQGSHHFNQKTVFYEESARVPLIVSQKGVTPARTHGRLVNTGVDLIPTLCDYAGIPVPKGLPGLSLKATANGEGGADPRRYVAVSNKMQEGVAVEGRVPKIEGRMIRGQRYKYCIYAEGRNRESLVDLETDPGEMRNLAADPKYAGVLREHRAMLAEFQKQTGDAFPAFAS